MPFLTDAERGFARAVAALVYGNPFLPERVAAEQAALGRAFDPAGTLWHVRDEPEASANVQRIGERVAALAERGRARLAAGADVSEVDRALYEDLVVYHLYDRVQADLYRLVRDRAAATARVPCYAQFRADVARFLGPPAAGGAAEREGPHLFACFFQVRRAFHHIYGHILGASGPARQLRAAVWQSIFTRDLRRYRRALYARMGEVATLIQGPTGTGKELVARAIGLARYIPFDPAREAFTEDAAGAFFPLHLAALSPTLIEAELFGHRRGAFTGALQDRKGWLEVCPPLGTVFLDEIGEVEPAIQVKLLRVLQTRTFQRLGETEPRRFQGKVIAATNRDLATEIDAGRFREDFYYRLCSDVIVTPSLAEQLARRPGRAPPAPRRPRPPHRRGRGGRRARRRGRRAGSRRTSGRTTPGRATCASSSSACGTSWCGATYRPPPPPRRGHRARRTSLQEVLRRHADGRRAAPPLLHAGLRGDRQLPGDGAPARARPADTARRRWTRRGSPRCGRTGGRAAGPPGGRAREARSAPGGGGRRGAGHARRRRGGPSAYSGAS